MIAACATRGWPAGLTGRRDAFLIVLTEILGYPHRAVRGLFPADITVPTPGPAGESVPRLAGRPVPSGGDPRTCPACAVARWLDILGVADGLGHGSARTALTSVDAPTPTGPHQHTPTEPARWRGAAVLLPAVDRHGCSTTTARSPLAPSAPDWPSRPGEPAPTDSRASRPRPHPRRPTRPRRPQQPVPRGPLPGLMKC